LEKQLDKFDEAEGEISVLGFTFRTLPKVKEGIVTKIYEKNDRKDRLMAFLTFSTNYGDIRATVFSSSWRKWKSYVKQGNKYKFVTKDGILEDIREVK
jgi:DNA polymerase III alpha subunit